MKSSKLTKLALALALATPLFASATSDITTGGAGAITATGNLDFRVIIPKFLFLQVGTGTFMADDLGNIDMVEFNVPLASLGSGAPIAQTSPASITARLRGNNGGITLSATTAGAMSNGAGDTISFTTITAAAGGAQPFAHPVFVDGASSSVPVPVSAGKITDKTTTWTFSYSNAAIVPAGTYGDTVANNGRVTYTASMP
ncbi:MAG TPA: hypothetical protein PK042_00670 [Usitatibacteraceae bacterium]|nr:hypothetical protein [Usitatibacteraceae bacterium]